MASNSLKFSGHHLILEGTTPFTSGCFDAIQDSETEHFDVEISETEKEILSIKKVTKQIIADRFISLYFNDGAKYPYSPTVATIVGKDLQELDNPRTPEQIEMSDQLFVLIDMHTQRIWISNQRQRNEVSKWMGKKVGANVIIKSIINESDFINQIKSVQEISFSIVPNLFNPVGQDTLSSHLIQDMYGFDAKKAGVKLSYNNTAITDIIKKKFNEIIGRKNEFQDITVIGKSDDGLDVVFNLEEVISKIYIEVGSDNKSKLFNPSIVFNALIKEIE